MGAARSCLPRSATVVVDQAVRSALASGREATRADLCRATGLSQAAVTAAIQRLTREGAVVTDGPVASAGRGRPAHRYRLPAPPDRHVVSVHLRRDGSVGLVGVDVSGRSEDTGSELEGRTRERGTWPQQTWDAFAGDVDTALTRAGGERAMTTVVLAVPAPWLEGTGPVRPHRLPAAVRDAVLARGGLDLPDWLDHELPARLSGHLGCEVVVANDANLAGLGEMTFGAGRGFGSGLHLSIRDGLGACLVIDGRVVTGAGGRAGELAHVQIDPRGALCSCGNRGCLATAASAIRTLDALSDLHGVALTVRDVEELVANADSATLQYFSDLGHTVGGAVASTVTLFDPHCVVVDSTLGDAAQAVAAGVRAELVRRCAPSLSRTLAVVPGVVLDPVAAGAAAVVRQRRSDPVGPPPPDGSAEQLSQTGGATSRGQSPAVAG